MSADQPAEPAELEALSEDSSPPPSPPPQLVHLLLSDSGQRVKKLGTTQLSRWRITLVWTPVCERETGKLFATRDLPNDSLSQKPQAPSFKNSRRAGPGLNGLLVSPPAPHPPPACGFYFIRCLWTLLTGQVLW